MAGYRRFIAYVYEYRKEKKGNNCGFIKVEVREQKCTLEIHLQCPGIPAQSECRVYGFVRNGGLMDGNLLGTCITEDGAIQYQIETDALNMGNTGIPLGRMGGFILMTESGAFFGTEWDDILIRPENFREVKRKSEEKAEKREKVVKKEAAEEDEENREKNREKNEKNVWKKEEGMEGNRKEEEKDRGKEDGEIEIRRDRGNVREGDEWNNGEDHRENARENNRDNKINRDEERDRQMDETSDKMKKNRWEVPEQENQERRKPEQENREQRKSEKENQEQRKPERENQEQRKPEQENQEQRKPEQENHEQRKSGQEIPEYQKMQREYAGSAELENESPKQKEFISGNARAGESQLNTTGNAMPERSMAPDEDGEFIDCRKIQLKDLVHLNRRDAGLRNNRFLQYGYYNFGHLLLCKKADGRYVLGVPGGYDQQERFMAGMFGFPYFKESRNIQLPKGRGGYWYRSIHTPNFH